MWVNGKFLGKTMLKYLTLFAFVLITSVDAKPMVLNQNQEKLLTRIQDFLNGINTMTAKFVQVTGKDTREETRHGIFKWLRPHHMLLDYEGHPLLKLSCDGDYFKQKDEDGVTQYEVWRTPASLLLTPSLNFKKNAHIKSLAEVDGFIMLEVAQKDDPDGPSLTLIFRQTPFALTQWKMIDASGNVTDVVLVDIEVGVPLKKAEFQVK